MGDDKHTRSTEPAQPGGGGWGGGDDKHTRSN